MNKISNWLDSLPRIRKVKAHGRKAGHDSNPGGKSETPSGRNRGCSSARLLRQASFDWHETRKKDPMVCLSARTLTPRNDYSGSSARFYYCRKCCSQRRKPLNSPCECESQFQISRFGPVRELSPSPPIGAAQDLSSCTFQEANGSCSLGSARSLIRTNPWLQPPPPKPNLSLWEPAPSPTNTKPLALDPEIAWRDSLTIPDSAVNLDDSMSSSGYASHDSSPESSVHCPGWSRDDDGAQTMTLSMTQTKCDKAVECDIIDYIEDDLSTIEDSECCQICDLNGNELNDVDADIDTEFHPGGFCQRRLSGNILAELDEKLGRLQEKQDLVNKAVARAKQDRQKMLKRQQICQEQLHFIRELKWVITTNFEVTL